jgi:hypothetical protein
LGVLLILPLALTLVGAVILAVLATRVFREVPPTEQTYRRFGRTVKPALVRVRDENARLRSRLPRS